MYFENQHIDHPTLLERAYNLRWAEVEKGIIPLTAADLDFPCATPIIEAIKNYSDKGYFSYGPAKGLPILKNSIAQYYNSKRAVSISADQILPINSAAFGIHLVCRTILEPGDEAIIFDPVDFLFKYSIEKCGGMPIPFPIPGVEEIDFSLMESLISKKTKLICLCNPLNPTGKVFSKKELIQLGHIACKYNLIILSDEIWSDVIFEPNEYTSIASLDEEINQRTIIVNGFSKSYGLAGLRIGSILTKNNDLFEKLFNQSLHQSTIEGVTTIAQVAAAAALNECSEWLNYFVQHLSNMRNLCIQQLNNIDGFSCVAPQGCYVAFVDITKTGLSSQEMYTFLLKKAKVAVVPGLKEWFGNGAQGYIRISFATSEKILTTAINQIHQSIQTL